MSGQVPVNNDAGETVLYRYQESDADITGQTTINYADEQSLIYEVKEFKNIEKKEYYVRIGDFRLSAAGIKNKYEDFEQYSEEIQLKLFDNFYLPVSFGSRRAVPYEPIEQTYKKEEYQALLSTRFSQYCEDLKKKGVEIIENNVKIYTGSDKAEAKGTLTVTMPIGTKKPSSLIEIPAPETEAGEE